MKKKEMKRYGIIALLALAVCIAVKNFSVISGLFKTAFTALVPLLTGCIIAYIFNIIMTFYERHYFPKRQSGFIHKSRRPVCVGLAFASAGLIITFIINIVYPELVKAVKLIYKEIPPFFSQVQKFAETALKEYPEIQDFINSFEPDIMSITEKVSSGASDVFGSVISIIGSTVSVVTNTVIAIIFAMYLLLRKDKLHRDVVRFQRAYLGDKVQKRMNHIAEMANDTFRNFFVGQFVEAIILGSMCFIGATILQLPYTAMAGTIVGVTALIPIVGGLIGAVICAFIIFTVNPMQALIFIIFLVILQQIEGNLIYPKVVGSSVGLPGIWVIAAVTVGGGLFGILGMLLGVPLCATAYKLIFEILERRERIQSALIIPEEENNDSGEEQK
ncbi:MAG: AI-2E family transporter [Ruminococcus flavefaciens]|nr:AI-2E family transporter [Ruminococcus flavefaciens]